MLATSSLDSKNDRKYVVILIKSTMFAGRLINFNLFGQRTKRTKDSNINQIKHMNSIISNALLTDVFSSN